mmetsp:Transcript_6654/g.9761  ORF Transcript_6654/g.9761 Transcript_6654/m.9761 type:complete len:540 (-) Transcript_6654:20-1639(-)
MFGSQTVFLLCITLISCSSGFVTNSHGMAKKPIPNALKTPERHTIEGNRPWRKCKSASSSLRFENLKLHSTNSNSEEDAGIVTVLPVVLPLLLVYISNQWSRSSLYYLVDFKNVGADGLNAAFTAMNQDIGFSEAQYGALASVAFTALFAITSLFAGGLADRYDRKLLTIGSACIWSLATFATAISTDYEQVLAARVLMGLACAFTTSSGYTLIRDLVPKERASLANSMYGSGVYLGGGLSSLSILLDNNIGWRGTCDVIAAYGLFAAALSIFILKKDPKMIEASDVVIDVNVKSDSTKMMQTNVEIEEEEEKKSAFSDVSEILSISSVQWLFAGSFVRFCSGLMIGVWAAPYYKLAFPDDASSYAVINALIVGLCGVTSGLVGGLVADKAASMAEESGWEKNAGRMIVPIVGSTLAIPAWWLTAHASTFDSAMTWLAIEYLVAECWFGPTVAVLQSEVGKKQGGVAQGLFTFTGAIGNLAPSVLGILYGQQMSADVSSSTVLSNLLANGVCAGYLLSAVFFAVSASKQIKGQETLKEA